ncbi:MAG: hypothetical protein IPF65_00330 [Polaromonas sp.]|jgi:hypothetical protein|nr:hypothetical protein [Polaromonas sp.]MBK7026730.1 hypothetical protein [Polaromonas sp.]MBL0252577.1 hypothetical protein [Polaromonas sp.]MBP6088172.1 hypothetical protein [Polaromonas sp.]MBP6155996.1 hypothetical protein [Polaromonas sp.]
MFLFFSVARSAQNSQAERAKEALGQIKVANLEVIKDDVDETEITEKMPTDKLVDVSPLALRMSSPFNAGYWLTAA